MTLAAVGVPLVVPTGSFCPASCSHPGTEVQQGSCHDRTMHASRCPGVCCNGGVVMTSSTARALTDGPAELLTRGTEEGCMQSLCLRC